MLQDRAYQVRAEQVELKPAVKAPKAATATPFQGSLTLPVHLVVKSPSQAKSGKSKPQPRKKSQPQVTILEDSSADFRSRKYQANNLKAAPREASQRSGKLLSDEK